MFEFDVIVCSSALFEIYFECQLFFATIMLFAHLWNQSDHYSYF